VPIIGADTEMASAMLLLVSRGCPCRFPVVDHLSVAARGRAEVIGDWQPRLAVPVCHATARPWGRAEDLSLRCYRRIPSRPISERYRSTSLLAT
jgi:hypothetical protein